MPHGHAAAGARRRPGRLATAALVLLPTWAIVLVAYVGTMVWTVKISFTASKLLPVDVYVGWDQYRRLFETSRWLVSLQNIVIFGILFILWCLVVGFLLAVALDQSVRFENAFRTMFLYPYAMSFIVTGLIWQWMMNPGLGIQKTVRDLGWQNFTFDWAVDGSIGDLRFGHRGRLAVLRARDGPDAGGPARDRRRNLEGRPDRRHPGLAGLPVDRHCRCCGR